MFTTNHFIWLAISACLIIAATFYLNKHKPPMKSVLSAACVISVVSELIKQFSMTKLIPSADGSMMYPYIELDHLPLHVCAIQVFLIFYVRFAKDSSLKTVIFGYMYPTCSIGALIALIVPTVFIDNLDVSQAFTHPQSYQYFLFHSVLVILGIYIATSGQVALRGKHYFTTIGILGLMAIVAMYLNSIFAVPVYQNGELMSVEYTTNFLFTNRPPIDIPFTQLWHWYLYFGILLSMVLVLGGLFYIPFFIRDRKQR